jgi:hypothetical protein
VLQRGKIDLPHIQFVQLADRVYDYRRDDRNAVLICQPGLAQDLAIVPLVLRRANRPQTSHASVAHLVYYVDF